MPTGTEMAVSQAARLSEIGFPEFTAKLITDTFDALVQANVQQTRAYLDLVEQVSKTLTSYINDTRDDIGGAELLQFLAMALPPANPTKDSPPSKVGVGLALTAEDVAQLNSVLKVPEYTDENQVTVPSGQELTQANVNSILEAVANRVAANKYTLLREMVKMGILRLVVENGRIETRLTFNTYGSTYYEKNSSQYFRGEYEFRTRTGTSFLSSFWGKAPNTISQNSVTVSTARTTDRDISGSSVQIYGSVVVNFKTDYQPLSV